MTWRGTVGKKSWGEPRGSFLTSPLAPRGEICFLGGVFTPSFTPKGERSQFFRRMEGRTDNFTSTRG
jgi:hypothetical protein